MIAKSRLVLGISPISLGFLGAAAFAVLAIALRPVDVGASASEPVAPPLDLGRLAAGESGAALSQPLFDPARRAWTARGSRADLTAAKRPATLLTVRGILIEDRIRRALVADGSGAPVWLAPGEGRGAWRLVSIEPSQVVVADSAHHYTLAFLGPPVALHPVPRYPSPERPAPEMPAPPLRPALSPAETMAPEPPMPLRTMGDNGSVRRIEITRPGAP
jgi:hypothetical protein